MESLSFGGVAERVTVPFDAVMAFVDPTAQFALQFEVRDRQSVEQPGGATETPVHWNLLNAWVSEWRGAPLDALGREIAIESMTLVFDSLERG